jgi:ring-1,2-phenylacetyl-CoA epoxidase subunit PaaC
MSELPLFIYTLRLADTALVLGHRLSEWTGKGPVLEEEMALANMGLDLIGQARSLYSYAGEVEDRGRNEDQLAYLREAGQYRNLLLVELPNGDFAFTMARQLFYSAFARTFWQAMTGSSDERLAAIAAKAEKEMAYHVRHSGEWLIRLGDGTPESHRRALDAAHELWPYTGEMFESDEIDRELMGRAIAVDPEALRPAWRETVEHVLREATLACPRDGWMQSGGRTGRHTEHLGYILAELQFLQRAYPGAQW